VFEDGRRGKSFTSPGNERKKLSVGWEAETAGRENRTVLGKFLDVITPPHIVREE